MTPEQEQMWKTLGTDAATLRRIYNQNELRKLIDEKIRAATEREIGAFHDRCFTAKKKNDS